MTNFCHFISFCSLFFFFLREPKDTSNHCVFLWGSFVKVSLNYTERNFLFIFRNCLYFLSTFLGFTQITTLLLVQDEGKMLL